VLVGPYRKRISLAPTTPLPFGHFCVGQKLSERVALSLTFYFSLTRIAWDYLSVAHVGHSVGVSVASIREWRSSCSVCVAVGGGGTYYRKSAAVDEVIGMQRREQPVVFGLGVSSTATSQRSNHTENKRINANSHIAQTPSRGRPKNPSMRVLDRPALAWAVVRSCVCALSHES